MATNSRMQFEPMLSRSSRVWNKILSWMNGTNFDPRKLRGNILGLMVNITFGEICCYRLIMQDVRAGELPSYTADLMFVIFGVFEAVVAPIVSWWGYTKRRKLFIGYTAAVIVCFLSWFLMPANSERKESELCDAANSQNDIGFIGTSTSTVFRLLMIIYSCIVLIVARVASLSHCFAYSDEYAPARTSMHYGVLLVSRMFPLVLGYKIMTDMVEDNLPLQIGILIIGTLVGFVQLPNAVPNEPPVVDGVQMEALPSEDRGLYASIRRVMNKPIAMTQMFSMGLVSASLWGYGYNELDINKAKYNLLPSSSGYINFSKILLHYFIVTVIAYAGAIFSDPILTKFCKMKTIKQAITMSVLMFVFYIVITMVPRCNTGNVVGMGKSYYSHPECSLACNCKPQWAEFKPVCAVDDMVSYVSPCQAGCRESQEINGIQVYSNCTCAAGGRVLERACSDESCRSAHLLHDLMFYILITFGILALQAQGVLLLKVVDPRDKSVAQGLAFSFMAILTFAVGHSFFYGLQITTCRWFEGNKCHLQSVAFPYLVGATCAFLMLTSTMTNVTSWHFLKMLKEDTQEDTNEVYDTRL